MVKREWNQRRCLQVLMDTLCKTGEFFKTFSTESEYITTSTRDPFLSAARKLYKAVKMERKRSMRRRVVPVEKPPLAQRAKDHCRAFTAFLFSNIGIIILVVLYMTAGMIFDFTILLVYFPFYNNIF